VLRILQDAKVRPDLFCWAGAVSADELRTFLSARGLERLPADLFELLCTTGGGDVFETEMIVTSRDSVFGTDADMLNRGFEPPFGRAMWLFHEGVTRGAVDLHELTYVSLANDEVIGTFATLDEWYVGVLRSEFAERYGLS
jgi:hypothetical protein